MRVEFPARLQRIAGRLFTLVIIAALALFLRLFGPLHGLGSAAMLLGFLLLAAFVAGELARELRLPRITGYLVAGIVVGPSVLRILHSGTVADFKLINGVALSVIALQAGGELRFNRIRERFRSIGTNTALQVVIILAGVAAIVYLARGLVPFLLGQPNRTALAVALIFGVVAVATSPAATIAVITELRARGPLAYTVLGVAVFKDVLVLVLIATVLPLASMLADPGRGFDLAAPQQISVAIGLSLALGSAVGWLATLYLEKVKRYPVLFVLAAALLIVEISEALGLEFILVSLAAGFVIQNFSAQGASFIEALEANSLPLYALFFAVAGASLDLGVIPGVWLVGLVIIVSRVALIYISTYLGAALAGDPPSIGRYAWMGFMSQAGVTLGLAHLIDERFAIWGGDVASIIIAMIAVNELVGPPLFRLALDAAGESVVATAHSTPTAVNRHSDRQRAADSPASVLEAHGRGGVTLEQS